MNEFSLVCRTLGSLFNRQPSDPLLAPLFALIRQGKLAQHWPLEQDALHIRLAQAEEVALLDADFNALFVGDECSVSPCRSSYVENDTSDYRAFLAQIGMPIPDGVYDRFGQILLASSWIEDRAQEDEVQAQIELFDEYLMPWCGVFLGKVEAHAKSAFYRTLAIMSREAIQAMREELQEIEEQSANHEGEQGA